MIRVYVSLIQSANTRVWNPSQQRPGYEMHQFTAFVTVVCGDDSILEESWVRSYVWRPDIVDYVKGYMANVIQGHYHADQVEVSYFGVQEEFSWRDFPNG